MPNLRETFQEGKGEEKEYARDIPFMFPREISTIEISIASSDTRGNVIGSLNSLSERSNSWIIRVARTRVTIDVRIDRFAPKNSNPSIPKS